MGLESMCDEIDPGVVGDGVNRTQAHIDPTHLSYTPNFIFLRLQAAWKRVASQDIQNLDLRNSEDIAVYCMAKLL